MIVRVFSLMLICCAATSAAQAGNLLENGSFKERDAEGRPKSWNIWGKIIAPDSKSSSSFLRITGTGEDPGNLAPAGGWQSLRPPAKKTQLVFSARVRSPDFAKRPGKPDDRCEIYLQAKFADGRAVYFGGAKLQTRERGWQVLQATSKIPEGTVELVALFNITALGTLEIDDVKLEAN